MKKVKSNVTENKTVEQPVPAEAETPVAAPVVTPKVENKITKVGSLLKEMRLQKGLRLPDVAKKLCIRKVYLEAIEESDYAEVPPFPYGIGFVRSYATFLGLNSGNIVELYKDETTPKSDKEIFMLEPQSEASIPNKKYLLISLLAIALVYAGWSAYNNSISEEEEAPAEIEQIGEVAVTEELPIVVEDFSVEPVMEGSEPEEEAVPVDSQITVTDAAFVEEPAAPQLTAPAEEPKPTAQETPVAASGIVIKVKEETWIEVKDADTLYISKVLQPGASYTVPEGTGMILSVGKANGVDVFVNGVATPVVRVGKKMNIALDPYLNGTH